MTAQPLTPSDVTPVTTGSWVDVDVSATVPSGATGVMLHVYNNNLNPRSPAFRKNGSTDDRSLQGMGGSSHLWVAVGVDGSRIFEAWLETSDLHVDLVGYFTDESVFLTNAVDFSTATVGSWVDVDISTVTGAATAIGAFFETNSFSFSKQLGLRMNGSTDDRHFNCSHNWCFVGVDGGEICEQYISDSSTVIFLTGYVTKDAVFNTNALDRSLGSTGSYIDLTALPAGALFGLYEVVSSDDSYSFHLRTNGSSEDYSTKRCSYGHDWAMIAPDASLLVEGRISNTGLDFFESGYFAFVQPANTANVAWLTA